MKITSINIPKDFLEKGLQEININRLGDTVMVAGKNGAGKTRLLNIVYECVNKHIKTVVDFAKTNENIKNHKSSLKNTPDSPYAKLLSDDLTKMNTQMEMDSYFLLDNRQENHTAINFVPNKLDFVNPDTLRKNEIDAAYESAKNNMSIEQMNRNVLAYIQRECVNSFNASHPDTASNPNNAKYVESFERLNSLVSSFLGTKIVREVEYCTIFGRDIGNAGLSDGQKVLLQLCVLIHAQGALLDNLILILDEPENHLHPEAQIEFIKKTKEVLRNGQIWIATHSIHILSYLDMTDIWYMSDGGIKYAGKEPERVLYGLLGGEDNVDKLRIFLTSPAMFAANQFAYECLFSSAAIMTGPDDKQISQISEIIEKIKQEKGLVTLLDYGAGTGRLLESIKANQADESLVKTWLDYTAYDKFPDDKNICENVITSVYVECVNRYFNNKNDLLRNKDDGQFDIVVMCNVLHEISPNQWIETFNDNSIIYKLLSDDGYVLVVEDIEIPYGERPNKEGFFILGGVELKVLFGMSATDFVSASFKNENRLFAHLIPKRHLCNITGDSEKAAMKALRDNCCERITELRERTDFRSGRLLGLWSQQLANIILYLK